MEASGAAATAPEAARKLRRFMKVGLNVINAECTYYSELNVGASMRQLVNDSQSIYWAAVRSAQADRLLSGYDFEKAAGRPLEQFRELYVVGAGKAAMAMAGALEIALLGQIAGGQVAIPEGYKDTLPAPQRRPTLLKLVEAGHPVPNAASMQAADYALTVARQCGPDDLLLVLLSGGGSALWCAPVADVTLMDLRWVSRALLRSGATIQEMNAVRKHLSRIKGGWLAAEAWPATTLTLVVSDVPADDLSVIASGPTVPDPTTFGDAQEVLHKFGLWNSAPWSVRVYLTSGTRGAVEETPGVSELEAARADLIGSNRHALEAAALQAAALGYTPVLRLDVTGEAHLVGQALATEILAQPKKACLLWGGETTVTVTGSGVGGRNHEVALGAALVLAGSDRKALVLSGGTDGVDGMTRAAGAWATPQTVAKARACGADPHAALRNNDSYSFFVKTEGSLRTGPTHTNVMDVLIALIA